MSRDYTHYVSPKLEPRQNPTKGNYGIYAIKPVIKGELLVVWGGDIVTGEVLAQLPERNRQHSIQIDENLYQVSPRDAEPGDFVNHSCNPNAGLHGQISLVAMRDIQVGEEICFDYAMSDGSVYDEFDCACGAPGCRGRVAADDWKNPELQTRYAGYFSPYLQRRIEKLRREQRLLARKNGRLRALAQITKI